MRRENRQRKRAPGCRRRRSSPHGLRAAGYSAMLVGSVVVVVDDKHAPAAHRRRLRIGRAPAGRRLRTTLMQGSADPEFGALPAAFAVAPRPARRATRRSRRTSVSPTPSPPSLRSSERSPCSNRSKMRGSSGGSMPMPLSRTVITRLAVFDARATRLDGAALLAVLGGVVQQVGDHLRQSREDRPAATPADRAA